MSVYEGKSLVPLCISDVSVTFGGTRALQKVSLEIGEGEIVGLLGHNGAGKSTLVNIVTGAQTPDEGSMSLRGSPVSLSSSPHELESIGIKVIHQKPALSDFVSVADNITLGRVSEKYSTRARNAYAKQALELLDSKIPPEKMVAELSFGEKQVVDLARALSTELSVLFLDEPTGALGQHEADRLHDLIREQATQGKAVIYVSHRLKDILSICTRIVVLRAGNLVLDRPAEKFTLKELSSALAPDSEQVESREGPGPDTPQSLSLTRKSGQTLSFRKGEIIGLFGMAAGPQFRLLQSIYAIDEKFRVELFGSPTDIGSPGEAISHGIYYLSENRDQEATLEHLSIAENLIAPWLNNYCCMGLIDAARPVETYHEAKAELNIRSAHPDLPITALSGGNAQKVMVGRWLYGEKPKVLMLAQPTQGIDVGARNDILKALRKFSDEGVTILVASSESDEIELLCDRAIVCQGNEWQLVERCDEWSETLLKELVSEKDKETQ